MNCFWKVLTNERRLALFPSRAIVCGVSLHFISSEIIFKSWITKGELPSESKKEFKLNFAQLKSWFLLACNLH